MTGIAVRRSRLAAYVFAGLLAAIGGLLLTTMTLSGDASATSGGIYTLSSIAAVVIGGTSLMGGVGGAVGSISVLSCSGKSATYCLSSISSR